MGVEGFFRSPNRGGALFACPLYSKQSSFAPCLHPTAPSPFPAFIVAYFQTNRAKVNDFLGVLGVFSGIWETKNGKI